MHWLDYIAIELDAALLHDHSTIENFAHESRMTKDASGHGQGNRDRFREEAMNHLYGDLRQFPPRFVQNLFGQRSFSRTFFRDFRFSMCEHDRK